MSEPTREQVLESLLDNPTWISGSESSGPLWQVGIENLRRLCALAFAAGAKAENEACEKLCVGAASDKRTFEIQQAIIARRPE